MADTREIVIKLVVNETAKSENKGKSNDNVTETGEINLSQLLHPIRTAENALKKSFPKSAVAYNYAKNAIKSTVSYALNRNFSLKEDYMSEVGLNNALSVIDRISSFSTALTLGASIGGPIGAGISAVGWVSNEVISAFQKYDRQQISLNEMNYQSTFSRTRMGLIDGGRGTEN